MCTLNFVYTVGGSNHLSICLNIPDKMPKAMITSPEILIIFENFENGLATLFFNVKLKTIRIMPIIDNSIIFVLFKIW